MAPEQRHQMVLFAERLDDVLPPDHCVRLLDELLHQVDWSAWEATYHHRLGQPAIHPRVVASVLLYGLLTRIRSSRGLEDALIVRLDFRWLAQGQTLDHTTISKFRSQHSPELQQLFVQVVQIARRLGLIHFQRLGFDGTRVRANNRRSGTRTPAELQQERDELAAQFQELAQQAAVEDAREEELFAQEALHALPPELRDPQQRLEKLNAVLHDLAQLEAAGATVPKRVPITDFEARVMPNKEGGCAPNFTPLATVDIDSGLLVALDVVNLVNEDSRLLPAIDQVQRQFGLTTPPVVLTDGLNGTGANLAGCAERGIVMYSPCAVPDPTTNPALRADPTQPVSESDWPRLPTHQIKGRTQLDKSAFVYDAAQDCYRCPLGQPLKYAATTHEKNGTGRRIRRRYQAAAQACAACPLRAQCLAGKATARQINREQHEVHRERHAAHMATPEAQEIYALRRHAGERPFAVIKQQFGLRRFLLRGLAGVRDEWCWAGIAFNIHRLLSLLRGRAGPRTA
jgi:transposase